jgi:hypothetical protein
MGNFGIKTINGVEVFPHEYDKEITDIVRRNDNRCKIAQIAESLGDEHSTLNGRGALVQYLIGLITREVLIKPMRGLYAVHPEYEKWGADARGRRVLAARADGVARTIAKA